ncbi:ABC transporter substrate-binding protein [Parvularcula sp. IMCC14364]|uniref:ABC transporter substrate-binding protein n=1 Tax=Parvularcula sp. IMCC14364 TaxID=3067902 RepID=UPI0027428EEF|nr:ABC transporter substrate-binding protein [Parvularcula sp. IMCC14364]
MALLPREEIIGLSPDSEASFSYLRAQAKGLPKVRPRAEDILLQQPDVVVRSYGGGATITSLLERSGIQVVQIGYANNITDIETIIVKAANALGYEERGLTLIQQLKHNPAKTRHGSPISSVLYLTSKGAVAGKNTMIDDIITRSGHENFRTENGWASSLPLEELVYEVPDIIATGFFETSDMVSDIWTPTRHPVVQRLLADIKIVNLPGAWTACAAWPVANAVEALSATQTPVGKSAND